MKKVYIVWSFLFCMKSDVFRFLGIFLIAVFALGVVAAEDFGVMNHESNVTMIPGVAKCDDNLNTFTVNIENSGNEYDIYNVKIYKALTNIDDLVCGPPPSGWTFEGFKFGLYCEYLTDPFGVNVISPGQDLDFTFDASIDRTTCISVFRVTSLDNQAIVTGSGQGQEVNQFPELYLDCADPLIIKEVGHPKVLGTGLFDWWISQDSVIDFTVVDNQSPIEPGCDLGLDYCEYSLYVDDVLQSGYPKTYDNNKDLLTWSDQFDEDSEHRLEVVCYDLVGNMKTLTEYDKVDGTPPETTKIIGIPKKVVGPVEWISDLTPIVLSADDPEYDPEFQGDCSIGVDKTWYRNDLAEDIDDGIGWDYCYHPEDYCNDGSIRTLTPYDQERYVGCIDEVQRECNDAVPRLFSTWSECVETWAHARCGVDEAWGLYDGTPVTKDEESCHVFQYFSIDFLGNAEDMKYNCFFVDKTVPEAEKWIGEPAIIEIDAAADSEHMYVVKIENPGDIGVITNAIFEGLVGQTWEGVDNSDVCFSFSEDISYYFDPYHGGCDGLNGAGCGPDEVGQTWRQWLSAHPDWMDWYSTEDGCAFPGGDEYPALSWNDGRIISPQTVPAGESAWAIVRLKFKVSDEFRFSLEAPGLDVFHRMMPDEYTVWTNDATPVELNCEDQLPHPSGDERVCFSIDWDNSPYTDEYCDVSLTSILSGDYKGDWCCKDAPESIIFGEDSVHELSFFCEDAVEKKSLIDTEFFRVDSTSPEIVKVMMGDDHLGYRDGILNPLACPPNPLENDVCYIGSASDGNYIDIQVSDPDPTEEFCNVDDVSCSFEVWWDVDSDTCVDRIWNEFDGCLVQSGDFVEPGRDLRFAEDSTHKVIIECEDALGNDVIDVEEFLVDLTPPVTTLDYNPDDYVDEATKWNYIDTAHRIEFLAEDAKVGPFKTWYKVVGPVEDRYCEDDCLDWKPSSWESEGWSEFDEPFNDISESCHVIEYYSEDLLGNREAVQHECVFVDHTKPVASAVVGEKKIACEEGEGCEWWINNETKITLSCIDGGPHPSGVASFEYRWKLDGAWPEGDDSWIDVSDGIITFDEDSVHELEYRCVDNVGKKSDVGRMIVRVDEEPPVITKTLNEPYFGDCSFDDDDDYSGGAVSVDAEQVVVLDEECFVDSATTLGVFAIDAVDPNGCTIGVGEDGCKWRYRVWNPLVQYEVGPVWTDWIFDFPITFPEESYHEVEIYCEDRLGNSVSEVEWFSADHTEPFIHDLVFEGPEYHDASGQWINSDTLIEINVEDVGAHLSGVNKTKYRWLRVEDGYCDPENDNYNCEDVSSCDGDSCWTVLADPYFGFFKIDQDSCHVIEINSTDNVGKSSVRKECVYVDNQAPVPEKVVSEPSTEWNPVHVDEDPTNPDATHFYDWIVDRCWQGEDSIDCWKVTLDTPISMDCSDPDPHPVGNEKVCFNVEMDGEDITDGGSCSNFFGFNKCGHNDGYCDYYGGQMNDDGYCCVDHTIEEFTFLEESEHNLKYYCEDALGNGNDVIDDEKFKVSGKMFKIRLNDKWNLISVPFVLQNDDPKEVFEEAESVRTVWSYDAGTKAWSVYRPGNEDVSNLDSIEPGLGYWILSDCEEPLQMMTKEDLRWKCDSDKCEMLVVGGSLYSPGPVTPPSQVLSEGWNLIGVYGDINNKNGFGYYGPNSIFSHFNKGRDARCELYSLENLNQEGSTKWSNLVGYWESDNPRAWYDGSCDEMDIGAGYWIAMREDGLYMPSSSSFCDYDEQCEDDDWDKPYLI